MRQTLYNPLETLQNTGLRATQPRVAVLSYLVKLSSPASIKDIQKHTGKRIDLVTLYRMMDDFLRAGLVMRVDFGKGPRFEFRGTHEHHHIVCTRCERVEDFSERLHEKLAERVLTHSRSFVKLTGHSFELYGLCNTCVKSVSPA